MGVECAKLFVVQQYYQYRVVQVKFLPAELVKQQYEVNDGLY